MLQRQPQRPRPRPREITIPEEEATRHRQQIQPQARPQQCLQLRVHLQHLLHHRQLLRQLQVNIKFWRENSNSLDFFFFNLQIIRNLDLGAKIQNFFREIVILYIILARTFKLKIFQLLDYS